MHSLRILLAEDMVHERMAIETGLRRALPNNVSPEFILVDHAESAVDSARKADLVVLDIDFSQSPKSRGMTGLEAARLIRAKHPEVHIVIVSSTEERTTMTNATEQCGVDWYLRRANISYDELAWQARQALLSRLHREGLLVEERHRFLTRNRAAKEILRRVDAILPNQNVLIYGETGTGKELIARRIHANARAFDAKRPFRAIDCTAVSPTLFEGEMFGHKRGAFTGALESRRGALEAVDGGDLFLDEIHNIPIPLQQKLLRVLNDGVFSPLGSNEEIRSKFRVITATNLPLDEAIASGRLLPDFVERVRKIKVDLLPLRERPEDVSLLVGAYVSQNGLLDKEFSAEAIELMKNLPWRGNARELKGFVDRATTEVKIPIIQKSDVEALAAGERPAPPKTTPPEDTFAAMAEKLIAAEASLPEAVARLERAYFRRALEQNKSMEQVAKLNGISRTTLYRKIRDLGLG